MVNLWYYFLVTRKHAMSWGSSTIVLVEMRGKIVANYLSMQIIRAYFTLSNITLRYL